MSRQILITGGAGFIGINAAEHFANRGWEVFILDNLSRRGSGQNLEWLLKRTGVGFEQGDIRDQALVDKIMAARRFDAVLHLAAQVAVTTSVADPREDFEINAQGTFNVLEACRRFCPGALFIYASTNKVYGKMEEVGVTLRNGRYEYEEQTSGISESFPLDFHSPYGCSKGCGDQYVIDYARIYGIPATSFRQSCIYGPRQFGVEDQGWVAWFTIAALLGKDITIYGDGRQIRDILHVRDLIRAYELAMEHPGQAAGQAFNIGGGPGNTLSLLELLAMLESHLGTGIPVEYDAWRPGDQRVFVCDIGKAAERLGWRPATGVRQGVEELIAWTREHADLLRRVLEPKA